MGLSYPSNGTARNRSFASERHVICGDLRWDDFTIGLTTECTENVKSEGIASQRELRDEHYTIWVSTTLIVLPLLVDLAGECRINILPMLSTKPVCVRELWGATLSSAESLDLVTTTGTMKIVG